MEKLLNYQIEWILPGHGQRTNMNVDEIHSGIINLIDIMKNS
ncbi:MAG: hypothetical protein ACW981_13290 [Candidatus Hodarchaeales archaeon]|jgi:hypothetical protein